MYTIGQFSKIARVSTKTLRYYDEINLLHPAKVDKDSKYRYYSDDEVLKIITISELKEYGLKLEEIKAVLDSGDDNLLKRFLKNKVSEISLEINRNIMLENYIEGKIKKIESGGKFMEMDKNLKVELKQRKPLLVASRRVTTSMDNIGNVIGKVFEDIFKMGVQPAGNIMTIYHDKECDPENTDFEVCIPISKKPSGENHNIKEFPGGLHACVTFVGPYSRLGEAYSKVVKWIDENGYKSSGAPFDIYLSGGESAKDINDFVTEVCFPVV